MTCTLCGRIGHHTSAKCPWRISQRVLIGLVLWAMFSVLGVFVARAESPPCIPVVKGTMAQYPARAVYSTLGRHFYWWCAVDPTKYYGFSCLHNGGCNEALFGTVLVSLNAATDKSSAIDALWANNVTLDLSTDTTGLAAERLAVFEANKVEWTATVLPVLKVAPDGAKKSRLAYVLQTGKLGPIDSWAQIGQPCDTTKPTFTDASGGVWASFGPNFKPSTVTLCSSF